MKRRGTKWLLTALTAIAAGPFVAPELLAFPYNEQFGSDEVWSVQPIPRARMAAVLDKANRLVTASPLAEADEGRRIFLTDGGWRWRLLALQSHYAFALTRAAREDVLLNRSDVASGKVFNGGGAAGRTRTIAGVIAHEKCHGMERRRFGILVDLRKPTWLTEGYCDYVAQESTLTAAEAAALKRTEQNHPALPYYEGRQRVSAILAANGGDVEALFSTSGR